jgi:hypothetical protein
MMVSEAQAPAAILNTKNRDGVAALIAGKQEQGGTRTPVHRPTGYNMRLPTYLVTSRERAA